MHDFIEYIIKKLVDKPDSVQLAQEENEANKVVFQLKVDQEDVGKVIGKKGRTANAIRTLLSAIAAREGKRAMLEIIDKQ
ncbi:MAG: KH domain-containing protein [Candidatus Kryptoniota bacterium]